MLKNAILNNWQRKKRTILKESETIPSEYPKPDPSPEPTYYTESKSNASNYPKPTSEYPIETSGPTYYERNDENSVRIYPHFNKNFY